MDAQAIVDKIKQDATEASTAILAEAGKRAEALQAASAQRVEKQKQDVLAKAAADGDQMRIRMLRMADLEDKKDLLQAKRQVMDKAFDEALQLMENMDTPSLRRYMFRLAVSYAQGNETLLLGDKNNDWFDSDFLPAVNEALHGGNVALDKETVHGVGFALKLGGTQVNCTMDAMLSQGRMTLETDVAKILFA